MKNIPFTKLENTRDLGGLPTKDGRKIKEKAFLRAAKLYQLVPSDAEKLAGEYCVAYDLDLRIDKELSRQPDTPIEGVEYRHYQLREDVMEYVKRESGETIGKMMDRMPSMPQMYLNMVTKENSLEALRNIFGVFFNDVVPGEKSALFHCTEGKDRTGIVAALTEDLLGVPRELIYEDYMLSNKAFENRNKVYYFFTRLGLGKKRADAFRSTYEAAEFMLKDMFAYLEERYGGTEGFFIEALGFSKAQIDAFREKVLED